MPSKWLPCQSVVVCVPQTGDGASLRGSLPHQRRGVTQKIIVYKVTPRAKMSTSVSTSGPMYLQPVTKRCLSVLAKHRCQHFKHPLSSPLPRLTKSGPAGDVTILKGPCLCSRCPRYKDAASVRARAPTCLRWPDRQMISDGLPW